MLARCLSLCFALFSASAACAQDSVAGRLSLQLNAVDPVENACRLSFVAVNGLAGDLTSVVFEAVLFDRSGQVDRLTLLDFAALPQGRPRVRQFLVPQLACDNLGQVLINGTQRCELAGGAEGAEGGCARGLSLSSRLAVEVIG
ncbi:MAG: hypothetical protein N4A53_00945 [Pelagimonas sp.]|jgi:hypothetical protein|nr:hypothetical protein [Pelagimonas sp.]